MPKKPDWFDNKISIGNVISWLTVFASLVYMVAFVRADINTLNTFRDETKLEVRVFREQRAIDRDALLRMEGDIKVIRQIVEQQARATRP